MKNLFFLGFVVIGILLISITAMINFNVLSSITEQQNNQTFECNQDSDCFKGGCSGEVCSRNPNVVSICIYKPEFECFRLTNCSCVEHKCQWQPNPEFNSCLIEKANSSLNAV